METFKLLIIPLVPLSCYFLAYFPLVSVFICPYRQHTLALLPIQHGQKCVYSYSYGQIIQKLINNTSINCVSHIHNCKSTFAPPCIIMHL